MFFDHFFFFFLRIFGWCLYFKIKSFNNLFNKTVVQCNLSFFFINVYCLIKKVRYEIEQQKTPKNHRYFAVLNFLQFQQQHVNFRYNFLKCPYKEIDELLIIIRSEAAFHQKLFNAVKKKIIIFVPSSIFVFTVSLQRSKLNTFLLGFYPNSSFS